MPRIRCNYEGCIHLEGNFCTAGEIDLDQELGCLTFSQVDEDEIASVDEELEEVIEEEVDEEEEEFEDEDEEESLEDWDEDEEDEDEDEEDTSWPSARSRRR